MNMMSITGVSDFSYQWVESNAEDDMSIVRDWITTEIQVCEFTSFLGCLCCNSMKLMMYD